MRKFIFLLPLLSFVTQLYADNYTKYIDRYSSIAVKEMERAGIPASITLAQAILESNAGNAPLAQKSNNHFGIKCHKDWTGKTNHYDDDSAGECFRAYPNAESSFRDHSDFLRGRDRYKGLFELDIHNYAAWAQGLKAAGYATDPQYAEKLIGLIERYDLARFDSRAHSTPATPLSLETPVRNYQETIKLSLGRDSFIQNGTPFIYAREGESYNSIAQTYNLFLSELLSFNDLKEDCDIAAGTIVYLAYKKTQGAKGVPRYVIDSEGETLYRISQRFGIRYSALLRMNIPLIGTTLKPGDSVILRIR